MFRRLWTAAFVALALFPGWLPAYAPPPGGDPATSSPAASSVTFEEWWNSKPFKDAKNWADQLKKKQEDKTQVPFNNGGPDFSGYSVATVEIDMAEPTKNDKGQYRSHSGLKKDYKSALAKLKQGGKTLIDVTDELDKLEGINVQMATHTNQPGTMLSGAEWAKEYRDPGKSYPVVKKPDGRYYLDVDKIPANGDSIPGFTWHHDVDVRNGGKVTMHLVLSPIHQTVKHIGGEAIWRGYLAYRDGTTLVDEDDPPDDRKADPTFRGPSGAVQPTDRKTRSQTAQPPASISAPDGKADPSNVKPIGSITVAGPSSAAQKRKRDDSPPPAGQRP